MSKRKKQQTPAADKATAPTGVDGQVPAVEPPHVIMPNAMYFRDQVKAIFRFTKSTLRREVREGRLKVAKRAGQYYLLGKWLLEWLQGGVVKPKVRMSNAHHDLAG